MAYQIVSSMNERRKICETFNLRRSTLEKSDKQKRSGSKKTKVLIALMFLALVCPKAWGYAKGELPPSFSEEPFSSLDGSDLSETKFTNENFAFSRAILTNEKGVAICQVNLVENPEFLPEFAEPGASNLKPLDLPECEEQSLDIVAQYAEQAWVKKEMAIAWIPAIVGAASLAGGCTMGFATRELVSVGVVVRIISDSFSGIDEEYEPKNAAMTALSSGGVVGGASSILVRPILGIFADAWNNNRSNPPVLRGRGWLKLKPMLANAGIGAIGGVVCYGIADLMFYE